MLGFIEFSELLEIAEPETSTSGNTITHSYALPGATHRIDVIYSKLQHPDKKDSKTYSVDFQRTKLGSDGKPVSSTFERRGMSSMNPRDRVSGLMAVRHSLSKFVGEAKPQRITYTGNTAGKKGFYERGIVAPLVDRYNQSNKLDPDHPKAAKFTGTGVVFPGH